MSWSPCWSDCPFLKAIDITPNGSDILGGYSAEYEYLCNKTLKETTRNKCIKCNYWKELKYINNEWR